MPLLIQHIDAIARQKQRDVLYVAFEPIDPASRIDDDSLGPGESEQKFLPIRRHIIDWLDTQGIDWKPCGHFADVGAMRPHAGQIYIDLPYDNALPAFQALQTFLEFPDGRMRFADATLTCCPLEHAMQNAAHDEPGFWERWAERF